MDDDYLLVRNLISLTKVSYPSSLIISHALHMIHVTPGLRYTHYSKGEPFLLAPNIVDFLVGFTF